MNRKEGYVLYCDDCEGIILDDIPKHLGHQVVYFHTDEIVGWNDE